MRKAFNIPLLLLVAFLYATTAVARIDPSVFNIYCSVGTVWNTVLRRLAKSVKLLRLVIVLYLFLQQFARVLMGTSNLKIPSKNSIDNQETLPSRACCVIVEFLTGGTPKQYLIKNRGKKLAYKIVVQLVLDLSRGLSYLHSKKIVHRDVKLKNMLLDGNQNLKIADFGVARVEAMNPSDMTAEIGTLRYMAPEVFDGKPYNRTCDVYSFGICLWEIYCCDMPYKLNSILCRNLLL
ncbi:unnamed protein product [Vicia faba]|uniref:Protein kinase domain-containing protein n=1 Tax=Vicia faba TaxID=3906 RepID=A0AAV0Z0W9_VICFA|nr:unnamed protein product [Vicia faba]